MLEASIAGSMLCLLPIVALIVRTHACGSEFPGKSSNFGMEMNKNPAESGKISFGSCLIKDEVASVQVSRVDI